MDIHRLNLNLLLVLDAMFEERQTVAVARRLKVSQPTISFSLNKLRQFFGDELFVRSGARMQPTAFAELLHEPVRRIVETINNEVLREQEFDPLRTERTFTFSMSDIGELVFLPSILEALRHEAPKASVQCLSMPPAQLEAAMAKGTIDIALGYFPDLDGFDFLQQKLFEHQFTCIVREHHPLIGASMTVEEFLAADHAVVIQEGRSQEIFERRMADLKLNRRILLRSPHFMSIPLLVATTDMITVVPRAVGRTYARIADVRLIEPPIAIPPIELKQFWHRRAHRDPAISWMRQLIVKIFLNQDPSEIDTSPIFGSLS